MNELGLPDMKALIAFGKMGFMLLSSRILSIVALTGTIALSAYVAYAPSWQGAACVGVVALFGFGPALKAEAKREEPKGE